MIALLINKAELDLLIIKLLVFSMNFPFFFFILQKKKFSIKKYKNLIKFFFLISFFFFFYKVLNSKEKKYYFGYKKFIFYYFKNKSNYNLSEKKSLLSISFYFLGLIYSALINFKSIF